MSAIRGGRRLRIRDQLPRWLRSRQAAMAMIVGPAMMLYVLWQLFGWPAGHRELISDLSYLPFGVSAIAGAWSASRRCHESPRTCAAWRMIGAAALVYLAGDLTWMGYALSGSRPFPSAADGMYLLFYPLMLWGLLLFPAPRRDLRERIRLGLDLAVMAIGGGIVVVYLVLGPTVLQSGPDILASALSIAYPVGDLILLVGLGSMLLRGDASNGNVLRLIALGLLCFVAGDLAFGYISLHSTYHAGNPVDGLWMVAMALFALGGAAQPSVGAETTPTSNHRLRSASWAPYAAVVAAFGVLILSQSQKPLLPDLVLVLGTCALAILASIRQILAGRDLMRTQGQLSYQSLHDGLTGVPNRALVLDRAEQMLARARRNGASVAALYIDVDGFKHVNDSFGHAAGDELLRIVADRLSQVVRESDTVGRLGGDEFVVLADNFAFDAGPEIVAERLRDVVALPVELTEAVGRTLNVTVSIGIALGQRETADELLRNADFALYQAKESGKNRWTVFESAMQTLVQDRLTLEMDLAEALESGQLFLLYQPMFDLRTGKATGVEALIRWCHPTRGILPPMTFIPLAEDTGLIAPIGRWVLRTACEQAVAWRDAGLDLDMSVNVSASQLDQEGFAQEVAAIVTATEIEPHKLTLEITESTLMHDPDEATERLRKLRQIGIHLAIDDFGTGYSSLAYLSRFPIDALKIDRSFVVGLAASSESQALIRMLVQLGKSLGLQTIGEGIEEQEQLRHLQHERCDAGQGFLFARPLEPRAVLELLSSGDAGAASAWSTART